jgi:hypothetical protein
VWPDSSQSLPELVTECAVAQQASQTGSEGRRIIDWHHQPGLSCNQ